MDDIESSDTVPFRFALGIEYDGSRYAGWQKQADPELPTIQFELEKALSRIADSPVNIVCAGRTDRGVHATGQVVHFDAPVDRGLKAWHIGTNSLLPEDIRVTWSQTVSLEFHARFSATARRYNYLIYESTTAPALLVNQLSHSRSILNVEQMAEAGACLLGENDFSAFRAAGCQSKTAMRCVHWLRVTRVNRYIVIDIQANAFLQHMVRNIAGMLMEVGRGERPPDWAKQLLASKDRTSGGITAAANGLYLTEVTYPENYDLPVLRYGPSFLQALT